MATDLQADAAARLELFFLDMGREKYGDSIFCRKGRDTILIDGGHLGDMRDRQGHKSIPNQLAEIFEHDPPFELSLLVITHCHNDHIGCLPEMVAQGIIVPEWVLAADENLGFGVTADGSDALRDASPQARRLVAALREEDYSNLTDEKLREFIDAAASLEDRYTKMLETLGERIGDRLVRYGVEDLRALQRRFSRFGLKILGPTEEHLLICAETIREAIADLVADVDEVLADGVFGDGPAFNEVAAYRSLSRTRSMNDKADAVSRPGFALNDQSIVLQITGRDANVLLTGDMQFAEPNIDEIEPFMRRLRRKIAAAGPYDLVKIAHHGSHNAFDDEVLAEMGGTPWYVISGGIEDDGHPHSSVLRLLRRERSANGIEWARTDKNGLITATFGTQGALDISRGRRNSAQPNVFDAAQPLPPVPAGAIVPISPTGAVPVASQELATGARTVVREAGPSSANVRVTTEIPHADTQVTLTVRIQPSATIVGGDVQRLAEEKSSLVNGVRLGGGRTLPPLLFVTSRAALAQNIGQSATDAALSAIRDAGQLLIDSLPAGATSPTQVLAPVQAALNDPANKDRLRGVVILGGYDVIPASRLDTIDSSLRAAISGSNGSTNEWDDFIVWSDAIYGDRDADGMGELPVSRIPDAHSAELFLTALQARNQAPVRRAGVRNLNRPFATTVFSGINYAQHPVELVSAPVAPNFEAFAKGHLQDSAIYLMLHGEYRDLSSFAGENTSGSSFTAINIGTVNGSKVENAVVFAGCCWGALTVRERAIDVPPGGSVTSLTPKECMALAFLSKGALAFVGCTGVHYSPRGNQPSSSGGPLHVAFWRHYGARLSPAEALFQAKSDYIKGIPHASNADAFARAVELKIMREFTCLGLGW
jgi:beta-lactamase superfamily II metal-dependent hydrolase